MSSLRLFFIPVVLPAPLALLSGLAGLGQDTLVAVSSAGSVGAAAVPAERLVRLPDHPHICTLVLSGAGVNAIGNDFWAIIPV